MAASGCRKRAPSTAGAAVVGIASVEAWETSHHLQKHITTFPSPKLRSAPGVRRAPLPTCCRSQPARCGAQSSLAPLLLPGLPLLRPKPAPWPSPAPQAARH